VAYGSDPPNELERSDRATSAAVEAAYKNWYLYIQLSAVIVPATFIYPLGESTDNWKIVFGGAFITIYPLLALLVLPEFVGRRMSDRVLHKARRSARKL
jgi:hypothetical protein